MGKRQRGQVILSGDAKMNKMNRSLTTRSPPLDIVHCVILAFGERKHQL